MDETAHEISVEELLQIEIDPTKSVPLKELVEKALFETILGLADLENLDKETKDCVRHFMQNLSKAGYRIVKKQT